MCGRAKDAELYPKKLLLEILRGMRDQADEDVLREEEEAEFQKVASMHSGFGNPDTVPYAPSISYSFARQDAAAAVLDAQLDLSYLNGNNKA